MYKEIWKEIKEQTLNTLPNQKKIWLQSINFFSEEGNHVTLMGLSNFDVDNFKRDCYDVVKNAIEEKTKSHITLSVLAENEVGVTVTPVEVVEKKSSKKANFKKSTNVNCSFNKKYTFDSFISGENSEFAFTAANSVAHNPGPTYNPLLIYGGVGLGKTHLLQAIGNYIEENDSTKKIVYVGIETFLNEFVTMYNNSEGKLRFQNKYRTADILLIDDIQFLENKTATQTELYNTFNILYENEKQMVFTSDRPVTELVGISDRLISRFGRGLSIDLAPPPYEVRFAILKKKCEEINLVIDNEILSYIANAVSSNVRDLEGILTTLDGYSKLLNQPITLKIAEQKIRDQIPSPVFTKQEITINDIIYEVSSYYNVEISDIKGKSRKKNIKDVRNVAIYLTTKLTAYTHSEIGLAFGGRDHSTVIHSKNVISENRQKDSTLSSILETIEQQIRQKLS